jgi:hypothetical protein
MHWLKAASFAMSALAWKSIAQAQSSPAVPQPSANAAAPAVAQ